MTTKGLLVAATITGGALDSREREPGPLYLQGDHRAVEFRNITITPAGGR